MTPIGAGGEDTCFIADFGVGADGTGIPEPAGGVNIRSRGNDQFNGITDINFNPNNSLSALGGSYPDMFNVAGTVLTVSTEKKEAGFYNSAAGYTDTGMELSYSPWSNLMALIVSLTVVAGAGVSIGNFSAVGGFSVNANKTLWFPVFTETGGILYAGKITGAGLLTLDRAATLGEKLHGFLVWPTDKYR